MHRRNADVPVEECVGAMGELVEQGKVLHLGLTEVSAETLRAASEVYPIAALQSEWSLFTREIEDEIVPAARELGVGIVPYSPLGRGELTGKLEFAAEGDFRGSHKPRFQRGEPHTPTWSASSELTELGERARGHARSRWPSRGCCSRARTSPRSPARGAASPTSRRTSRPPRSSSPPGPVGRARRDVPDRLHGRATGTSRGHGTGRELTALGVAARRERRTPPARIAHEDLLAVLAAARLEDELDRRSRPM